jgi:phosphate:Na+ symporter
VGTNIGTTITAQIVAFKVAEAVLLMIVVGFGMLFVEKGYTKRAIGFYGDTIHIAAHL